MTPDRFSISGLILWVALFAVCSTNIVRAQTWQTDLDLWMVGASSPVSRDDAKKIARQSSIKHCKDKGGVTFSDRERYRVSSLTRHGGVYTVHVYFCCCDDPKCSGQINRQITCKKTDTAKKKCISKNFSYVETADSYYNNKSKIISLTEPNLKRLLKKKGSRQNKLAQEKCSLTNVPVGWNPEAKIVSAKRIGSRQNNGTMYTWRIEANVKCPCVLEENQARSPANTAGKTRNKVVEYSVWARRNIGTKANHKAINDRDAAIIKQVCGEGAKYKLKSFARPSNYQSPNYRNFKTRSANSGDWEYIHQVTCLNEPDSLANKSTQSVARKQKGAESQAPKKKRYDPGYSDKSEQAAQEMAENRATRVCLKLGGPVDTEWKRKKSLGFKYTGRLHYRCRYD